MVKEIDDVGGRAVAAGADTTEGKAGLRRKRLPVELVGEEDPVALRLGDREAALVGVLEVALEAAVEPAEDDLRRLRGEACLLEERRERRLPLAGVLADSSVAFAAVSTGTFSSRRRFSSRRSNTSRNAFRSAWLMPANVSARACAARRQISSSAGFDFGVR